MLGRMLNTLFLLDFLFLSLLLLTFNPSDRWATLFLISLLILVLVPCANYIFFGTFRIWNKSKEMSKVPTD